MCFQEHSATLPCCLQACTHQREQVHPVVSLLAVAAGRQEVKDEASDVNKSPEGLGSCILNPALLVQSKVQDALRHCVSW